MKGASSALINFMLTATSYARADLYTITLSGGGILRYSTASGLIYANGFNYGNGPLMSDAGVKSSRGLDVAELDITFYAGPNHMVNGVQFLDFVENLGFDGAMIRVDRAVVSDWLTMRKNGPIGTYIRFSGHFSEAKDLGHTAVTVTASSPLDLFTNNVPFDVYQTSCGNVLGDSECLVDLESLALNATVTSSPLPTTTSFDTTLTPTANDYALGSVKFLTGVNAGLSFTVKSNDGSGGFVLSSPMPTAPSAGDTVRCYPGCDLSTGRCTSRFNNLIHYRGEPFIPDPSTGLPS